MTRSGRPFAIVDVETTGCNPLQDRIIEIAVIRLDGGGEFSSLVHPGRSVPPFITGLTGICDRDLREAPPFEDIAAELADLLEGAVFVAHNARFDYAFVRNEFKRVGITFVAPTLCTVRLSRKLYPQQRKHSLESIIARHNLVVAGRHRALADARAVADFLDRARAEKGAAGYDAALAQLLKIPSLPAGSADGLVRDLPVGPGVYLLHGAGGEVLYVGKGSNIRERVLSHFAGDHGSAKELDLCRQVTHIEARSTAGELSALLLESELVKELAPVYNRRLHKRKKLVLANLVVTEDGYETIRLAVDEGEAAVDDLVVAQFRTRRQAEEQIALLAKLYHLSPQLLGIEKGVGACLGLESPEVYNARFRQAFALGATDRWPYAAPVLVSETGDDGAGTAYVVDRWRITATIDFADDGAFRVRQGHYPFDHATCAILRGFLATPRPSLLVRPLHPHELALLSPE